ncbi:leucine zipper domain-containing protein [Streptomyces cinerochromogenes]|uniref:leucine zipper domain-containing protein n=1 Tax=Streptomyces cinerochromogenes TaxID=66422 RepID=UPI0036A91000
MVAEAGISRRCLAKWYARRRAHGGGNGLLDHSSRPATSPRPHPRGHGTLSRGPSAGPPGATTESSSASRPHHARTSRSSSPSRTSRNQGPKTPQLTEQAYRINRPTRQRDALQHQMVRSFT